MLSGASCKEFKLFSKRIMVLLSPFFERFECLGWGVYLVNWSIWCLYVL